MREPRVLLNFAIMAVVFTSEITARELDAIYDGEMPGILRTDRGENPSMKQHNARNVIVYPAIRFPCKCIGAPTELFGRSPEGRESNTPPSLVRDTVINPRTDTIDELNDR